jgi:hypothetical protein
MRQTSKTIFGSQEKLRLIAGDHFIALPMKIKKADVTAKLVDGVLEAGTLITASGAPVTTTASTTDAYGIIYQSVDFNDSMADDSGNVYEVGSVLVHGVVYESAIKLDSTNGAVEKAALKQIIFGA